MINNTWLDEFYSKITTRKHSLAELIDLLGEVSDTNIVGNIKNIFINSNDKKFDSIYISQNADTGLVLAMGFYGSDFKISFVQCRKYAANYTKQFIIYDENVEYIFALTGNDILRSIVCKADEITLHYTKEEDVKLCFNNMQFYFKL